MKNKMAPTLFVISQPGRYRESLCAFINNIPEVQIIKIMDRLNDAIVILPDLRPAAILVDSPITQDSLQILQQAKVENPGLHCIMLVENQKQKQITASYGFNYILIKGFKINELENAIRGACSQI
jgi:DNA-binding NarL/FixJ family response regulator